MQDFEPEECLRLLATVPVGRVGVTIDALPAVLPVNFVVTSGAVVFAHGAGDQARRAATAGAVVAFEADSYGTADAPGGWSVLVRGIAREVTDPAEIEIARALPFDSWAWDGAADRFVMIEPTVVTGRRIVGPDTPG